MPEWTGSLSFLAFCHTQTHHVQAGIAHPRPHPRSQRPPHLSASYHMDHAAHVLFFELSRLPRPAAPQPMISMVRPAFDVAAASRTRRSASPALVWSRTQQRRHPNVTRVPIAGGKFSLYRLRLVCLPRSTRGGARAVASPRSFLGHRNQMARSRLRSLRTRRRHSRRSCRCVCAAASTGQCDTPSHRHTHK